MTKSSLKTVLAVDVLPYKYSTRTRKFARSFASMPNTRVHALTLDQAGRMGFADIRSQYCEDEVFVEQVQARAARTRSARWTPLYNLLVVYIPALIRLAKISLSTPADIVILGNTSLFWITWLHQRRYSSRVVVSTRERPGGVRTRGSLGTLVSRTEPLIARYFRRSSVVVVCVCQGHAEDYRGLGVQAPVVVRNAPSRTFSSNYFVDIPPLTELIVVLVGSLYPGRALESLISGAALARSAGVPVSLKISGKGTTEYLRQLERHASEVGVRDHVEFLGEVDPPAVRGRYESGHIGAVLYEPTDSANDSLSNKMFESISSGRPVLAGNLSENVRFLRENPLGWTCEPTPSGIARGMETVWQERASIARLARLAHSAALDELNWESEVLTAFSGLGLGDEHDASGRNPEGGG